MQEDHVSMGWAAARKLRAPLDNLARILAVELGLRARGLELRAPLEPGRARRRPWPRSARTCRAGTGPLARARARGGEAPRASGGLPGAVEAAIGALR